MATLTIQREDLRSYRGGARFYTWKDTEQYPSVTSLIDGGLPKPALPRWAAKETAQAAVRNLDTLNAIIAEEGERAAVDFLKGAPWRKSNSAASQGSNIHEFLEALAQGRHRDAAHMLANFAPVERFKAAHAAAFLSEIDLTVLEVEAVVFSRQYGYAGSADLIVDLRDARLLAGMGLSEPTITILDLKTGKGVYNSAALQLSAYANADFIGAMDGTEKPMPDIRAGAVLHVNEDGWAFIPLDIGPSTFQAFLACAEVATWSDGVGKKVVGRAIARGKADV